MAPSDDAASGILLGRYQVQGIVGEGSSGSVLKAYDTQSGGVVAIKTLTHTSQHDLNRFHELEEQFAREAEVGTRVGLHPCIVSVYDLVRDAEQTQYLVRELMAGGTLANRAEARSVAEVLRQIRDVAQGLHVAHETGLVHRNVKPSNIFLTADGRAKIGDFSVAQIDDFSAPTNPNATNPGTLPYMSPEQERRTASLRPASDQYSLGLVLFELLTTRVYKQTSARSAASLIGAQPAAVQTMLRWMLADNPDDRYKSLADVAHAADAAAVSVGEQRMVQTAHDAHGLADGKQGGVPPKSPTHTRRGVLIGAGGVVLASGIAGGAFLWRRGGSGGIATAVPVAPAAPSIVAVAATAAVPPSATVAPPAATVPPTIAVQPIVPTVPTIAVATPTPLSAPSIPAVVPTVIPTPSPTIPPPASVVTPAGSDTTQTTFWAETDRRVTLSYPRPWTSIPPPAPTEVLELDSKDGVHFNVYIAKATGTPMEGLTGYRDRQNRRPDRAYFFKESQTGSLGGVASVTAAYQSVSKKDAADVHTAEVVYVNNDGWAFTFEYFTDGTTWRRLDEIRAMMQSVSFRR